MASGASSVFRQPVRFLAVGALNALVGLTVIFLLKWTVDAGDTVANLAGYTVGLAFSLVMNGRWTFAFRGRLRLTLWRFIAVVAVAYVANLFVVTRAIEAAIVNAYVAQALGVVPYSLLSYFGFKYFVFREAGRRI